jgi:chromate transporter
MNIFIKLFISFFKIGAFSFGGGYAMLPLIEEEVIQLNNWITTSEFIDILAISEMTPGPIAINSATFLGYKIAGLMGSAVATFAVTLPSFLIMTIIFLSINKFKDSPYVEWAFEGIRPVVIGLILAAAINIGMTTLVDLKSIVIAILLFYVVAFKNLNPIIAIVIAGILGIILY